MRLLFVCSGNICRSPISAEYMRHRAADLGLTHVVVDSAGTLGIRGAPASDEAVKALAELGIDLSGHRSTGVETSHMKTADFVIGMTHDHLIELAARFPEGSGERLLIRAFESGAEPDPNPKDLPDPIGQPIEFYRNQLLVLTRCLDHLALYLKHLGGRGEPLR